MHMKMVGPPTAGLLSLTVEDVEIVARVTPGPGFRERARTALVTQFQRYLDGALAQVDDEGRAFPE